MKILVLEDDPNARAIVEWLVNNKHDVRHVVDLRDATYFLEYEEEGYDRLIFDACVARTIVRHKGGIREYNEDGEMNGVRYLLANYDRLKRYHGAIAIYTAYKIKIQQYPYSVNERDILNQLAFIDKSNDNMINMLADFLNSPM